MRDNEDLARHWCLVTGSNRGIGRATLLYFAANGWNIVAHSRRHTQELDKDLRVIADTYGIVIEPICFDLTDSNGMKREIRRIAEGGIVVESLVNCAGIAAFKFFPLMHLTEIRSIFDVNLFSYMELTQLMLRNMMRRKKGAIVNVSSIAGFDLKANNAAYGVSKAAVSAFTKELAMEMGQFNIRVNAVAPGIIDTDMVCVSGEENYKELVESSAMKRPGKPEEVAKVIYWLCTDEASYVNGQVIRIDGGMV